MFKTIYYLFGLLSNVEGCKANYFAILEKLKGVFGVGNEQGCVAMKGTRGSREAFIMAKLKEPIFDLYKGNPFQLSLQL